MQIRRTFTDAQLDEMISQRVNEALAVAEAQRVQANASQAGGSSGNNAPQGCTYKEFSNCKPQTFTGIEGPVGLMRWFERLESVFRISNYANTDRVKFTTCTLQDGALTWWNNYAQPAGLDVSYAIPWEEFKQVMISEYCPRNKIQKLEMELWNLKIQGNDITRYTKRFLELALLCPELVTTEAKKIERYVWGLSKEIQEAIADTKTQGGKRKWNENQGNSSHQKKQDTTKFENASAKKNYNGKKPYCNRCYKHHYGACTIVCDRCKKVRHMSKDCRVNLAQPTGNKPKTCYGCGEVGHMKNQCPNAMKDGNAKGRVFNISAKGAREDLDLVTGTFLLNNCIAYVLFDSGADRSFISKDFSTVINIPPTALDTKYIIELANGKTWKVDKIFRGCALTLADKLFEVDLMPVELGSFDVIIGMDWLSKNHADIACADKSIRIPLANGETLVVQGEKSGAKLNIISCMKTRKYLRKGCQAILAHVKEMESEKKRLEDVQSVQILGHVVSSQGIHVDPAKIEAIGNWEKGKKFEWLKEQESAFQQLKHKLTTAPILSLPEGNEDFVVYCDASRQGLGCVLMQRQKVIAYASRQLKTNVVADALTRNEKIKPLRVRALNITIHANLVSQIRDAQLEAVKEEHWKDEAIKGLIKQIEVKGDGTRYFTGRLWVPKYGELRKLVLDEAHKTRYSIHPETGKMYHDIKEFYWWPNMKADVATYVSQCLTCAKVKVENQKPPGLLQQPEIPQWKWERITIDFITKLPRTVSGYDTIWIQERLKTAMSRQKSYADVRRKFLEFQIGDKVMLKVSPRKGVIRFGKRGKLSPRYVGPFEII
ncbi:uncharacterized protein [Rutidosis leptorrhynchoides]|uniref:uncharacterized protein n=1 Tax=Rutidosis leptorrhynchoides TaxID=125765 RepID=UPI003A99B609